jgi:hypothetical protein
MGPASSLAASQYVVQGKLGGDSTVPANTNNWIIPFVSDFDPQSWWINGGTGGSNAYTSSARIQPTVEGYYQVSMGAWWAVGSTTSNQINVQAVKNSNSTLMIIQETIPTSNIGLSMGGSKMVYMNGTTDYLSFTAFTANSGGQTLLVGSTATGQGTWCSAHLIAYGPGFTGFTGPTGPTGLTGPTGYSIPYIFDGGDPNSIYSVGPAFDAGGVGTTGPTGGTNLTLQFRRGTSTQWSSVNPTLANGELAIETDTRLFKIGNGVTGWNLLPYGGLQGYTGVTGFTGFTGLGSTGVTGFQGTQGPTGPGGGGGGSVSITGSTAYGNILTVATGGAGIFGNSNFVVAGVTGFVGIGTTTPATQLDVNGGVTIRNGYRPIYSNVTTSNLTVAANSYGTHFNITNSAFATMTLPTIVWAQDSNGYWVFRNNTSSYLSVTITYQGSYTSAPTNPVVIPPSNSTTIMVTFPGGSSSNYVLF